MKLLEFAKHFDNDETYEIYLKEVREKEGVIYSKCGCKEYYWNEVSEAN